MENAELDEIVLGLIKTLYGRTLVTTREILHTWRETRGTLPATVGGRPRWLDNSLRRLKLARKIAWDVDSSCWWLLSPAGETPIPVTVAVGGDPPSGSVVTEVKKLDHPLE